jgi:hypothetical protein
VLKVKAILLTPCCSRREKLRAGFANDLGARLSNGVSKILAKGGRVKNKLP